MFSVSKNDCLSSNKCIYGLVQAARQYHKKAVEIVKKFWYIEDNVTHDLKKSERGIFVHRW